VACRPARALVGVVLAVLLAGCSGARDSSSDLAAPFSYDASKPLELQARSSLPLPRGIRVSDISFAGPRKGRIDALLVTPAGSGKKPAIIYAHGSGGGRADLLEEAVQLALDGSVGLALEMSYSARHPNALPGGIRGIEIKTATEVEAVVDVRRAIDLLRSRPDVDPARIGYVGWSAGARMGAIVAGIDHRIRAFDLLAGGAAPVDEYLELVPTYQRRDVRPVLSRTDPLRYVGHAAPSALFFQNGRFDEIVPRSSLARLARAASRPKQVRWYDSGHEPSGQAWLDSRRWLLRRLAF
jgi:dienelactone hydrolase